MKSLSGLLSAQWPYMVLACMMLVGCNAPVESDRLHVSPVFDDGSPLAHRHRMHSLTESPDGQMRIYAAQKGDVTDLMIMRRTDRGEWGAPALLDLPRFETNTSPRFFPDSTLYYSSDAPHPKRAGRKDLNIWRVSYAAGRFGTPEVLPDEINTGSHEDGFAYLGEDRAVFSSTTIGGVGGYDLYIAKYKNEKWTVSPFPHNTQMADSHPVATQDGMTLIWYAHMPLQAVYGSVDLFFSEWKDGHWEEPSNLGPIINTQGIEYGAGISADGATLFFSRDGILLETNLQAALRDAGYIAPK